MLKGYDFNESKIAPRLGCLNYKQRLKFIDTMEKRILEDRKPYDKEYFYWLENFLLQEKDNATSFDKYKEVIYYLEKLEWIRKKNIELVYSEKEEELYQMLKMALPKELHNTLNELIDNATYRELELHWSKEDMILCY